MTRILVAIMALLLTVGSEARNAGKKAGTRSIVILYENDVHCAIDGYKNMQGLYNAIRQADTCDVAMVSCGDFLQGALAGALSQGKYVTDIMRVMSYDALTLGNHEFDYGVPRMMELLNELQKPVTSVNFFKTGAENAVYQPYVMKCFAGRKIAFVGVTTPETMRSEAYAFVDAEGHRIYDLRPADTYRLVQDAVDAARKSGADYVVVLSHLGEEIRSTGIWSHGLVEATHGIDVVLDGHTHAQIVRDEVANNSGNKVPLTQTGTEFANVGKLIITADGRIMTELIPLGSISYVDERVAAVTDSVKALIDKVSSRHIATLATAMPVKTDDGVWIVRREQAAIGSVVAAAYRTATGAEIGLVNGGSLRNGLPAGDINYGNVISVQPFDNHICLIEATGEQILGMLRKCTANYPKADGSFPHVAGMRYVLDTVTHDVTGVEVEDGKTGCYTAIEPGRCYTVGVSDYYSNGGFYGTLKDCRLIKGSTKLTRDVLAEYLEHEYNGTTRK